MDERLEVMLDGRRYVICRNPEEAEHDRRLRDELVEKLTPINLFQREISKSSKLSKMLKTNIKSTLF